MSPASTATASVGSVAREPAPAADMADQIAAMPSVLRMQMQLIAHSSRNADQALEPIVKLIVGGSQEKHAAIVAAFRTHEALREQWARTYELLKS